MIKDTVITATADRRVVSLTLETAKIMGSTGLFLGNLSINVVNGSAA